MKNIFLIFILMGGGFQCEGADLPKHLVAPHPLHEKYSAEIGKADALEMIEKGKITIIGAGTLPPCEYILRQKIYRNSGIEWTVIGEYVSDDFEGYRNSFNETMAEFMIKHHGENFFVSLDKKVDSETKIQCKKR